MNISAEWIINKFKQRVYAISHAKVVVRNKSTVDADLTNIETRLDALESNGVGTPGGNVGGSANIWLGKALAAGELTIPTVGWVQDDNCYHLDITNSTITSNVIPIVVIAPTSRTEAYVCGLKNYCQTTDGVMRLFSEAVPRKAITASIALVGQKAQTETSDIPTATEDTAGLVKIGEGFKVDETGTLKVDTDVVVTKDNVADPSEAEAAINEILNG